MALLTVKTTVWFDVADGRESERVSERELTCMPPAATWNDTATTFQMSLLAQLKVGVYEPEGPALSSSASFQAEPGDLCKNVKPPPAEVIEPPIPETAANAAITPVEVVVIDTVACVPLKVELLNVVPTGLLIAAPEYSMT